MSKIRGWFKTHSFDEIFVALPVQEDTSKIDQERERRRNNCEKKKWLLNFPVNLQFLLRRTNKITWIEAVARTIENWTAAKVMVKASRLRRMWT